MSQRTRLRAVASSWTPIRNSTNNSKLKNFEMALQNVTHEKLLEVLFSSVQESNIKLDAAYCIFAPLLEYEKGPYLSPRSLSSNEERSPSTRWKKADLQPPPVPEGDNHIINERKEEFEELEYSETKLPVSLLYKSPPVVQQHVNDIVQDPFLVGGLQKFLLSNLCDETIELWRAVEFYRDTFHSLTSPLSYVVW